MFSGIKKAVIKSRIKELLKSKKYVNFLLGGYKSTGGKVANYIQTFWSGIFASSAKVGEINPEVAANIVAESYDPIMNIIKESKELVKIFEEHKPLLKEVWDEVNKEWNKWEKQYLNEAEDIGKDIKDLVNLAKDLNKEHLQ